MLLPVKSASFEDPWLVVLVRGNPVSSTIVCMCYLHLQVERAGGQSTNSQVNRQGAGQGVHSGF
jgi:hypothetical protein